MRLRPLSLPLLLVIRKPALQCKALLGKTPWGRVWRELRSCGLWIFMVWACWQIPIRAAVPGADEYAEYEVKATYLFNLAKFTEWPSSSFARPDAPLVIGVVGKDSFGRVLDEVVKGETIHHRPLEIKRLRAAEDAPGCHILFVSHTEKDGLSRLLKNLEKKPVLTVGEADRFCHQGGMINLVLTGNHVIPEINLDVVRSGGLRISSKLLNLRQVRHVKTERETKKP